MNNREQIESLIADKNLPFPTKKYCKSQIDPQTQTSRLRVQPIMSETYYSNFNLETQKLEHYYQNILTHFYQANIKTHPEPKSLIQILKAKEKQFQSLQKALHLSQEQNRQLSKQMKSSTNTSTNETINTSDNIGNQCKSEQKLNKNLAEELFRIKLKFMGIFQEFLSEQHGISLVLNVDNLNEEKICDFLEENIRNTLKTLKNNALAAEMKVEQKYKKKISYLEEKHNSEKNQIRKVEQKLNNKIEELSQQLRQSNMERKSTEKQKNELHLEIYKIHQSIIQKSNVIEQFRQKLQASSKLNEQKQKDVWQSKKIANELKLKLKQLEQENSELQKKNKHLSTCNEKIQKEMQTVHKKLGSSYSSLKLTRVKSQSSLTSIKLYQDETQSHNQAEGLQDKIKDLEHQIVLLKQQKQKMKEETTSRQKLNLQKIINQWKAQLQKIVDQNDRQMVARDSLITALQNQVFQLKKEIQVHESYQKFAEEKLSSYEVKF